MKGNNQNEKDMYLLLPHEVFVTALNNLTVNRIAHITARAQSNFFIQVNAKATNPHE
jgi:hypothetical protein